MVQDVFVKLSLNNPKYHEQARTNMLKQQIRTYDVTNDKILKLFYHIPREDFVPEEFKSLAFADIAIPLGNGQSMMPPAEEARILQELDIQPEEKILMLGVDSGFMLAVLSKLGKQVYYLDNDLPSFEDVKTKIDRYQLTNITPQIGNINFGWQALYPFNVILLTGSLPSVPDFLKNALAINGRLFVVVGAEPAMEAMIITRMSEGIWSERKIFETIRPRMLDVKEPNIFIF